MRVLVFGGTKGVGRLFAEQALEKGHEVTVFARDPAALGSWRSPALRVVKGDARVHDAVTAAVPKHDAVVVSLGPSGAERLRRFIGPATKWIVQAMEENDVRRLLFMSAVGVGESFRDAPPFFRWFVARLLLRTTFRDRDDAEAIVKASRLEWTLVRPFWLTDETPTGRWRATTDASKVRRGISRADVAAFLVGQLTSRSDVHKAVALEAA